MKTDLNIFAPCPRCDYSLQSVVDECPSCGLSLLRLDEHIGAVQVILEDYADPLSLITESERAGLSVQVAKLRSQIPWLRVIILTTELPSSIKLDEFLFWLLHRGRISGRPDHDARGAIIIGIDAQKHLVGIAAGFQVYELYPQAKVGFKRLTDTLAVAMHMVSPGLAIGEILERMGRILTVPKSTDETSKAPY